MVRILRDRDIRELVDLPAVVSRLEQGYVADARGDVVPFPRSRIDARGTTLAWLGAAIPAQNLLAFRSYLYRSDGYDRGEQVVALYGHSEMELRALFVGRLVGNLRTGAAIAAAFHLADPGLQRFGLIGTGHQARNALACIAATFRSPRVAAWSPRPDHRRSFRDWGRAALGIEVDLAEDVPDVLRAASAVALVTSSETPVITSAMMPDPKLLLSINAYRRPEIDLPLLDAVPWIWTDSVAQASGPGTLFEGAERRSKLRPLGTGLVDGTLPDARTTRLILNTGAAWEELAVAQTLFERAESRGAGTELTLPPETVEETVF